jgi:putative membrane protein
MSQAPLREAPWHYLRGTAMGSADLVPGVSGGTVALVLAVYQRLVTAIRTGSTALGRLLKGDVRGATALLRAVDWAFLVPLMLGILTAVVVLAGLIEHQLETRPVAVAGLFFGLVTGSVVVALGLLPERGAREWVLLVGGAVGFAILLGFTAGPAAEHEYAADVPLWQFFGAGAIAVCAMILPAVSGSFLLVVLGMYAPVLAAVSNRDHLQVITVGLGAVVGLALFSQLLHWLLAEHYEPFMALMIGLMIGSLRLLWPWPQGALSAEIGAPREPVGSTVALALIGLGAVLLVDRAAHRLEHRGPVDEVEDLHGV